MVKNTLNSTWSYPLIEAAEPETSSEETSTLEADPAYRALLVAVWNRNESTILQRAKTLRATTASLLEGMADVRLAEQAESDAHKLSGCLGSFGLDEASRVAQEIERILRSPSWTDRESRRQIAVLADSLEQNILLHRPRE